MDQSKEKLTVELRNKQIAIQRAAQAGMPVNAWLDRLIERADLLLRMRHDEQQLATAGLVGGDRDQLAARARAALRAA